MAIVGEPNAGKSTLVNHMVGGKVSIVTPKVQTTRFNVRGVCNHGSAQLVCIDTPGIFNADKRFEKAMVQAAWSGAGDADAVLVLVDAKAGLRESTRELIASLATLKKPLALLLNKVYAVDKQRLFTLAQACTELCSFDRVFMVSARQGDGVADVVDFLSGIAPPGPWLYPEDHMSDISMRLLAAEITREKLFLRLDQELPYSTHVETEAWQETESSIKVAQVIVVQREGQKKIVIGEKGAMLKDVGTAARLELARIAGKKVHLSLFVKVRPGWKDDRDSYDQLGLEYKK